MKAVLIGATGAVGKDLLQALLEDARYTEVVAFARRALGVQHEKLREHTIDFDAPATWQELVKGDVLFSTLGTSLKQAGSKEAQRHIDYDYQLTFAKAARANGVKSLVLLSSIGANSKSSIFYLRLKGELDDAVQCLGFDSLSIVRPPSLIRAKSKRFGETASVKFLQAANAIGLAKRLAPMETAVVARSMAALGLDSASGTRIIEGQDVRDFA
ncbi:NAD(P)H-binding protein [Selenomonas sp. CM52]|uniref:NAD(P)H-binding protein n=1 Tax=Selenomonas sp. CM52 TaxID=936381 RepID=UPI00027C5E48|nr:NAD(P)H-binding protein [Selenomonas sp. CM52]EJU30915.1 NADH(P)-binding protein, PF13460 family [Selenomonas sp. CM52]